MSLKIGLFWRLAGIMAFFLLLVNACQEAPEKETDPMDKLNFPADNAGLRLPNGFKAMIVADSLGKPRHIAVTKQGAIYAKLRDSTDSMSILYLEDEDGDGSMDAQEGFGEYGGTGIYLTDDYLYASSDEQIFRYALGADQRIANATPDTLVTGLIARRSHATKSLTLDGAGNIYVNIGAYSNACQEEDRKVGSPAMQPCTILDSAGGIWKFRTDQMNQSYAEGTRYATGLRNVVGLDWNANENQLYVTQHGRDMLHTLFPKMYTVEDNAELPAETLYAITEGDDAGWPYFYYDQIQGKLVQSPEYGGDGQETGDSEGILEPVTAFPGHMGPNALLFYTGDMFPERYKNGAFVAFHGSWNRAPLPQKGYMVAFVPFENGTFSKDYEIFADGFKGKDTLISPSDADYRPTGLAQGPDGSLYVSDDAGGAIFRIVYAGE